MDEEVRQHRDLAAILVATGRRRLVERAPDDAINRFWSEIGDTGTGENQLGRLLMELRAALAAERHGMQAP